MESRKAEIRITILPPWWLSNGMLVVYGILIVLAIALGYALLLQRTNRRHRNKIAALHHENERKLFDAKIGFFTHITHEIRTPVTLILAPVEEIMRQKISRRNQGRPGSRQTQQRTVTGPGKSDPGFYESRTRSFFLPKHLVRHR